MGAEKDGVQMTSGTMYNWRVSAVKNALAGRGKAEGPLTVDDLVSLGHLDQYHYLGVEACDHLLATLQFDATSTVLDVGSGIGGPARYLAIKSGCEITGVELQADLNEAAAELTERVGISNKVHLVTGDFVTQYRAGNPLLTKGFDHFVSLLVFLHIPDRDSVLQACFDALNPGGTFLIEDFALIGEAFTPQETEDLREVVSACSVTSSADYMAALERAGFADVVVEDMTPVWQPWTKARHVRYRESREETVLMHGEKVFNDRVAFYEVIDSLFAGGNLGGVRITGRKRSAAEEKLVRGRSGAAKRSVSKAVLNELGSTVSEKAGPALAGKFYSVGVNNDTPQPLLPAGSDTTATQYHDSLQYHFFFPDAPGGAVFVAGRVFHTVSLQQHSAWMYEAATGKMTELFPPCYTALEQAQDAQRLDLRSEHLRILDSPEGGEFEVVAAGIKILFKQCDVFMWLPAGQADNGVIHRPNLHCTATFGSGAPVAGSGYSKRYYGPYPRYWGYRFIHGVTTDGDPAGPTCFWNADAAFGDNKYNYFKVLPPSGGLVSADTSDCWQQDTSGFAVIDGVRHETRITPLCTWETIIGGPGHNMESKMQNRYCGVELIIGESVRRGVAYNERCYGTLG